MSGLRRNMMAASRGAGVDWESAARAFCGDTTPETLVIPEGITKLRNYAFYKIVATKVILPSTLVDPVGIYCFDSCANLNEVVLGDGIERLRERMFSGCPNLKSLTIPTQVNRMDNFAFTTLDELICLPTTPPVVGQNLIKYVSTVIYVPDASVSAYKAATYWSPYASIIKPLSELVGGKRVVINWLGGITAERSAA